MARSRKFKMNVSLARDARSVEACVSVNAQAAQQGDYGAVKKIACGEGRSTRTALAHALLKMSRQLSTGRRPSRKK